MSDTFGGFSYETYWSDAEYFDFEMTVDGSPADLTGATLYFMAKRRISDPDADAVFSKQSGAGITVTNAMGGLGYVEMFAADYTAIDNWYLSLFAQLIAKNAGGQVFTTKSGILTIKPRVRITV